MKTCSKCQETKPLCEFSKNKLGALGVRADCRLCVAAYDARRYAAKAEQQRKSARMRRAADPIRHRAYVSRYYAKNAERIRAESRAAYKPEEGSARAKEWRRRFPSKHVAEVVRRDAAKIKATPVWANAAAVLYFYEEARRKSEETGILHHVDHIYPLRGKEVCGLHNEFNLQVLPAKENQKKYNSMPANIR